MRLRPAHDVGCAHSARLSRNFAATSKQRQRRDAADIETCPEGFLRFGIDLGQPDRRFQLRGRLLESGRHLATRAAPRCPEIDQNRNVVSSDVAVERRFVQRHRMRGEKLLMALSAVGCIGAIRVGNPVGGVAMRANDVMCGAHEDQVTRSSHTLNSSRSTSPTTMVGMMLARPNAAPSKPSPAGPIEAPT